MSALKIFISYCWKDKVDAVMKSITNKLRQDGWDIWVDIHNLSHGDSINPTVSEAIKGVDLVLFMWSENFAASAGCQFEVQTTFELNKPCIPCKISDYKLTHSLYLNDRKSIDFFTPIKGLSGIEWGWTQLRQLLLELEGEKLRDSSIQAELQDIRSAVAETEDTIYRMRQNASGNDSSDPFIQSMMMMAKQMSQSDSENGQRYMQFCTGIQKISAAHPSRAEDAIKKQKMINLIDNVDPNANMPILQRLKMMTLLSFTQ
jgi:hypothetical protein